MIGARARRSGSLLIITLWLVTILSVFAVAIARYLSTEIRVTKYRLAREQAETLARSGVHLAMERLKHDAEEDKVDWAGDDWAAFPGGDPEDPAKWVVIARQDGQGPSGSSERIEIHITDEERRLDLNADTTSADLIDAVAGIPGIGQSIVSYRDQAKLDEDQPDASYYAKNGPIRTFDELLDIPQVRQQMQKDPAALAPLFEQTTVYTEGHVNLNTASEQVLLTLKKPLIDDGTILSSTIQNFVQRRGVGLDGKLGGNDDCLLTEAPDTLTQLESCIGADPTRLVENLEHESSTFRVIARGIVAKPPLEYRVEAIVKRSGCPADSFSPCVIAWKEGS